MDGTNLARATYLAEADVAGRLAIAAGRAAMLHYGSATGSLKDGGSPVTSADTASNAVIMKGLHRAFPNDAILSEEASDSSDRLTQARLWIVDPLDGTKEFLAMNGEFAVMIGFAQNGRPVVGALYLPADDLLLTGIAHVGAWSEHRGQRAPIRCPNTPRPVPRLIGSRSHAAVLMNAIATDIGAGRTQVCGSVGVKCARVLLGRCDLYVHPVSYLKEWDTCAPEAVVCGAGGSISDCQGNPLTYNKADPIQPHGIIVHAPWCNDASMRIRKRYAEHNRS